MIHAQGVLIYNSETHISSIQDVVETIYNLEDTKAQRKLDSLHRKWKDHPILLLLRALNIYWREVPLTDSSPFFTKYMDLLKQAAKQAKAWRSERFEAEYLLYEMVARGWMAENYAYSNKNLASVTEANRLYRLLDDARAQADKNIDIQMILGLYNYFREKYPEEFPIYKPLAIFFRRGDKEGGINQIKYAARQGILTQAEALLYLAYIYWRYEHDYKSGARYFSMLYHKYPKNRFYAIKLAQCLIYSHDYLPAIPIVKSVLQGHRRYDLMMGNHLQGILAQEFHKDLDQASRHYLQALSLWNESSNAGKSAITSSQIRLGEVAEAQGRWEEAERYYKQAIDEAANSHLKKKAKKTAPHSSKEARASQRLSGFGRIFFRDFFSTNSPVHHRK